MPASVIAKNFRDGTLQLKDGAGTPNTLTLPLISGSVNVSGLTESQKDVRAYQSRGNLVSLRKGEATFPTVSFQAMLADLSDGTNQTAYDFCKKVGSYSGNTSTTTALGDVYTIDIVITIEGTDLGDASDHTLTLEDVSVSMDIDAAGDPSMISFSGTVYGTVTAT